MLEIRENMSAEGYEELSASVGCEGLHITEAFDKDSVTGFIAYFYDVDRVCICDFDDGGDLYLCDGLVRSVLFKGCLKGMDTAEFRIKDEKKYERLMRLKFVTNDERILQNLNEFMNSCKNCKSKS